MLQGIENSPAYLENFSKLYAQLQAHEAIKDHPYFHHIAWNMVLFAQSVRVKEFAVALEYLEKTMALLEYQPSEDLEICKKLTAFVSNLKNQFDNFLKSK